MMQYLSNANLAVAFAVLYFLCEALAHIPSVESNSVFQAITKVAKYLYEKFAPKPPEPPAPPAA